jgi:hypothetical protein
MKAYDIEILSTIRKTIRVMIDEDIKTQDEAEQYAHETFSVLNDGSDEDYDQETLSIEEVDEDDPEEGNEGQFGFDGKPFSVFRQDETTKDS